MNTNTTATVPTKRAEDYLNKANIKWKEERLSDGSKVYNLLIGDVEFPCVSEAHAYEALRKIAAALHYASV